MSDTQAQEHPEYNIGRGPRPRPPPWPKEPVTWPKTSKTLSPVIYIEHEERGTSYRLVIAELPHAGHVRETAPMLVAMLSPHGAAYTFQYGKGILHWSYIGEKFKLGMVDAEIVARLIGKELERESA